MDIFFSLVFVLNSALKSLFVPVPIMKTETLKPPCIVTSSEKENDAIGIRGFSLRLLNTCQIFSSSPGFHKIQKLHTQEQKIFRVEYTFHCS